MERINTPDTYESALPAAYDRRQVQRPKVLLTQLEARREFAGYLLRLAAKVSHEQRTAQSVSQ